MKKGLFVVLSLAAASCSYAQKTVEFHLEQARAIEPIQQVMVRPLVADLKILETEMITYPVSWQLQSKRITDISEAELDNAIKSAIHKAALISNADLIVASTYEVRNHVEKDKKGNPVVTEMGIDIIVSGYPAKYENWRKFGVGEHGEKVDDASWATVLISAQSVYSDLQKTKAITNNQQ